MPPKDGETDTQGAMIPCSNHEAEKWQPDSIGSAPDHSATPTMPACSLESLLHHLTLDAVGLNLTPQSLIVLDGQKCFQSKGNIPSCLQQLQNLNDLKQPTFISHLCYMSTAGQLWRVSAHHGHSRIQPDKAATTSNPEGLPGTGRRETEHSPSNLLLISGGTHITSTPYAQPTTSSRPHSPTEGPGSVIPIG